MNLILLTEADFITTERVRLTDARFDHIKNVHQPQTGESLKTGLLNGAIGIGEVIHIDSRGIELRVELTSPPPSPLPVNLILALPRPKMLKRIIETATSLGVKRIYLVNAYRVEKSYWGSPVLQDQELHTCCRAGLEQAVDTIMPQIILKRLFKPFVQDELPGILAGTIPLVGHPYAINPCPVGVLKPVTLAIGPEGGFIPWEIELLQSIGFIPVHIGKRILRVETAIPCLLARLFSSCEL
ncbi:MAG TPA: 16S rRNA (uracil(1498)-N(3))-methyltransferase [bacterium]|mgnify:CR=1 FL=1|nr:16S rRNA (uracil(1498)-N(3))-methyltransferase [bacterium]HPN46148.1 16S rRNA (uracil(1498)-N(3))-methyltransferase [bacterium]